MLVKFSMVLMAGMLCGCAATTRLPEQALAEPECRVETLSVERDGQAALQMTNHCSSCLAVAFASHPGDSIQVVDNGCYVPAETRVLFRQAGNYHVLGQSSCEQVKISGGIAGIDAATLLKNYHNGRCEILGVFAD
jgi:hypothetical protein